MTNKHQPAIVWRFVGPGWFPGVPQRDLTQADFDELPIIAQQNVVDGKAYEAVAAVTLDPLREMDDTAFKALSPSDKAARTKEANARAEAEAKAAEFSGEQGTGNGEGDEA